MSIPDLRQRIADTIDRLYDAGAIYAIEDSERDALAAALLPLFAEERAAAYRDGQAQSPDESVQVNGVKYRDAATARAAGAFSQCAADQPAGES